MTIGHIRWAEHRGMLRMFEGTGAYVGYVVADPRYTGTYIHRCAVWDAAGFHWVPVSADDDADAETCMRLVEAVYALEN